MHKRILLMAVTAGFYPLSGAEQDWHQVAELPTLPECLTTGSHYLVAGGRGYILHSADGTNWMQARLPETGLWIQDIAYGGNSYVAVTANGRILVTEDPAEWTESLRRPGVWMNEVRFLNNWFEVKALDGSVLKSTDGRKWSEEKQIAESCRTSRTQNMKGSLPTDHGIGISEAMPGRTDNPTSLRPNNLDLLLAQESRMTPLREEAYYARFRGTWYAASYGGGIHQADQSQRPVIDRIFPEARVMKNSWRHSEWFGTFKLLDKVTIRHVDLGRIEVSQIKDGGLLLHPEGMPPVSTDRYRFPEVIRIHDGVRLRYQTGSRNPRLFYNLETFAWEKY